MQPDPITRMPAARGARRARLRRLLGLIRKETFQIVRDPSSILIAGVLPLLLLLLFSYGVSFDLRDVQVALVIERPSASANRFAQSFIASRYFNVRLARDRRHVQDLLLGGRVHGIIVLAADFDERLERRERAPVQVLVRGSDPNTATLVNNYVQGAWRSWLQQEALARGRGTAGGIVNAAPAGETMIAVQPRVWFNPDLDSRDALLPGSIAVTMTLIGTLLTALVVVREWERGTMEALLATPVARSEILLGKLIPYFLLGMGSMMLSVLVARGLLGVPLRGSLWLVALVSAVFLCYALGLGLLISTLTRNQFVASQAALVSGFLPALYLSGLIFEIGSMPTPVRLFTYLLPPRYFVTNLQTLFLAGNVASVLVPNTLIMAAFAAVFLALTARATRRRLE